MELGLAREPLRKTIKVPYYTGLKDCFIEGIGSAGQLYIQLCPIGTSYAPGGFLLKHNCEAESDALVLRRNSTGAWGTPRLNGRPRI